MRTLLRLRTLADAVCFVLVRVEQIAHIVFRPPCCLCVPRSGEQRCWQMWVGPVACQRTASNFPIWLLQAPLVGVVLQC